MWRPSRKQFCFGAFSVVLLVAIVASIPPVRVQYHKWRLESTKVRKARMLAREPSTLDRFWLNIGNPVSGRELDARVQKHENALVGLGFLDQTSLPAQMVSACADTRKTLDELRCKCPWYRAETVSGTNLVLTACTEMMADWRQRAKELGW